MVIQIATPRVPATRTACLLATFLLFGIRTLYALDISDVPLETAVVAPPPIVMFVLDNSASMNMEVMTDEFQGLFKGACYLFPDSAYEPAPDHRVESNHALCLVDRRSWQSQWAGYNRLYYSPTWRYDPWPSTARFAFDQADLQRPLSDPIRSGRSDARMIVAAPFLRAQVGSTEITVPNAHYYTFDDVDGNGLLDAGEILYLVTWTDQDQDGMLDLSGITSNDRRCYYRLTDDGDGLVEDNELVPVIDEAEKNRIRPAIFNRDGNVQRYYTDREDLQNFVNWFTYYRRREFAAKAVVAQCIDRMKEIYIGLYALNGDPRLGARLVRGISTNPDTALAGDQAAVLLDALYTMETKGNTPLRTALDQVGRYLHQSRSSELGESPFQSDVQGGGCQKACSVVITDGYWNDAFSAAGNADGDNGVPYADVWSDTLADVAMTYYENDLAPNLNDLVPASGCDAATHQHMNTHVVSFGPEALIGGGNSMAPGDISGPCLAGNASTAIDWPQPSGILGVEAYPPARIDLPGEGNHSTQATDLWHTALNGRGRYFDVHSPKTLMQALPAVISEISAPACAANMAVNSISLGSHSILFQASYHTKNWSGDVSAYPLDAQRRLIPGQRMWCASEQLKEAGKIWDQRRIVTYGRRWDQPQGLPFRYEALTAGQLSLLTQRSADKAYTTNLIDFMRGKPVVNFRSRETLIGDIVHSGPELFGQTLFVGANDGMLHAFDADTGAERFAYLPGLVFNRLEALSDRYYADHHQYYVDGPLYAGEAVVGEYQRKAYLVGGLGKGGKGYFCMLIGRRERTWNDGTYGDYRWSLHVDALDSNSSEEQVAELIQWEYPRPDTADDHVDNNGDGFVDEPGEYDPDIGHSFGQAYVVNANVRAGRYRPVVIFGNGYGSDSQKAVLYVLDADSGEVIRTIDTGASGDNGLSTPALIDVDLDRRVDYAYAGDLNGNLWKFDLTSDNPSRWGVAYGVDNDSNGVIDAAAGDRPEPLFQTPGQPITGRPNVMAMHAGCEALAAGYMVYFGTGRYLGFSDVTDVELQSVYAIWDYGDDSDDSEYVGRLTSLESGGLSSGLTLFPKQISGQTEEQGVAYRQVGAETFAYSMDEDTEDGDGNMHNNATDAKSANPVNYVGWFLNLPLSADSETGSAERITGDVIIRGGKIIVPSYVPDRTPCSGGGHSWLYILEACNGDTPSAATGESVKSRRFQGKISNRPVVVKDPDQPGRDRIVFGDHTGNIMNLEIEGETWGKVYWRQN